MVLEDVDSANTTLGNSPKVHGSSNSYLYYLDL